MKPALLVIDVQQGLFDETPRPFEADTVIERINTLTSRARQAGVPVVFIQHETADDELAHGSQNWQLQCGLQVAPNDTKLRKTTPDSFLHTNLEELLDSWNVEQVVICGYATEFCVDTTTRRAAALGYPVTLAADAHTTHDKKHANGLQIRTHHNATLSGIDSFGPRIQAVPTSELHFQE
ncbi:isochorismatase family protein [Collimonas arenae]|uniref:Isochorismatase family protein n=1 Tax=Collimonas arenae TaxID=279058 RepID=A0A127PQN6_9BURK|nr:cysteine hydrolase family protein [Collimonas arenae]AMO99934.1 isochorismatase family protein [Collimonas arenae]AMP09830.1 isochorismatase family protein [Collimonas arenae]